MLPRRFQSCLHREHVQSNILPDHGPTVKLRCERPTIVPDSVIYRRRPREMLSKGAPPPARSSSSWLQLWGEASPSRLRSNDWGRCPPAAAARLHLARGVPPPRDALRVCVGRLRTVTHGSKKKPINAGEPFT